MPWLQIKAWGEKAQWKPGRVTHILHYIVASSPAARCLLPPCRKRAQPLLPASSGGLAALGVPRFLAAVSPSFPRRFDGKCQRLSPWSMRTFRSYVSGSDTSAVGCLVTTHQVTLRAAVYQHSALIKGEEVRRVMPASKCFHTLGLHRDCFLYSSSSFFPSLLNWHQVIWGEAAGRKVFTIVNFNVCGSPFKDRWQHKRGICCMCQGFNEIGRFVLELVF